MFSGSPRLRQGKSDGVGVIPSSSQMPEQGRRAPLSSSLVSGRS